MRILTEEEKKVIANMARDIKEIYDFSLVKIDSNFMKIEDIADKIGGGVIFNSRFDSEVCRCGAGFVINLPKKEENKSTMYFAIALAMLFFEMKYQIDDADFMKNENMKFKSMDVKNFEILNELADELICSASDLRYFIKQNLDENGNFNLNAIAEKIGLNGGYLEARLIRIGCIKHWTQL